MLKSGKLTITSPGSQNNELNEVENSSRFHVAKVGLDSPGAEEAIDMDGIANNQYTYVYDTRYQKSLGQLTREALPKLDNYRDVMSVHAGAYRPTLDELHNETFHEKPKKLDDRDEPLLKGKVIKFSWLEGVFMRCLLNIWGVMLFLRLSWVVGQAGLIEGILIISFANLITYITSFSMSAVSTNGQIRGGGIYYMISRSLGPEFGAAIGLMFTIANSIAVSMYIVGFCESLRDLLKATGTGYIIDGAENDVRVVGIGVLIGLLILAFIGMDWVTRCQMFLLFVLIAAQINFIVGSFLTPTDEQQSKGFVGYSWETFKVNSYSDYQTGGLAEGTEKPSFFSVFGVFFPAVTGIVAGANLSGDLKDPATAIPKGTILAITVTYISYIVYALMMAGCVLRAASGDIDQYLNSFNETAMSLTGFVDFRSCDNSMNQTCKYGLLNDAQVMTLVSGWGYLIYMGCFAATLSSAIASLVGAPRVFQALAKDKLYPFIHFFAKGYGANNDPVRGYCLVFVISLGCLLIANLNPIAGLLTNFFLAAYFLINFSVFHATITKSPGWRPSFKYYNAWVSLGGCILCIAAMFLMSWATALATVGITAVLYFYVAYRGTDVNWGSSTQAQSYNSALKAVQDLNLVEEHVKNYRPQILILTGLPSARPPLIDFANLITKNMSMLICGQVIKERLNQKARNALNTQAYNWLKRHKKKGFYVHIEEESFEKGCHSIMQVTGLGKLKPNMVLLGFKDWKKAKRNELVEYFNIIHEAMDLQLAVGILRVQGGLDFSNIVEEEDQMTEQQFMIIKKEKDIPRNQSETRLSQDSKSLKSVFLYLSAYSALDGTSSEASSSPPSSPKVDRFGEKGELAVNKSPMGFPKKRTRKSSGSHYYTGPGGTYLSRDILSNLTQFTRKQKKGTIDVWWLYDDGGLTLLLPYLLTTRSIFAGCQLRIFSLSNRKDELGSEQRNMAALLAKFRIDYSDVIVIPDITKKAQESTKKEFETLIRPFKSENENDELEEGTFITDAELLSVVEKTNRHLRLRELLLQHSKEATFIVMTLPIPRRNQTSAPLYLSWLEIMSAGLPPFLFVRGNQQSVLTFYS